MQHCFLFFASTQASNSYCHGVTHIWTGRCKSSRAYVANVSPAYTLLIDGEKLSAVLLSGLYCWPGGGFGPSDLNNFGVHQISDLNCFDYESFHLNLPGVHLISEMYNAGLHQFSDWNHPVSIRYPTSFFGASNFRFEAFWGPPNFRSELVQFIYLCSSTCSQDC